MFVILSFGKIFGQKGLTKAESYKIHKIANCSRIHQQGEPEFDCTQNKDGCDMSFYDHIEIGRCNLNYDFSTHLGATWESRRSYLFKLQG
jgi:hypothetical protein